MTATASPVHMLPSSPMRFGVWHALPVSRSSRSNASGAPWQAEWHMRRNVRIPLPHLLFIGLMLSLTAGLVMGASGLSGPSSLPLACVAVLAMALWVARQARIAQDSEHIGMRAGLVRVTHRRAGRVQVTDFSPRWVRVEPELHDRSLVCFSGQGRSVTVGGHLPAQARRQLADEIRWALQQFDD